MFARLRTALGAIANDYRAVFIDQVEVARKDPSKALWHGILFSGFVGLIATRPNEQHHRAALLDYANRLRLLSHSTRNPKAMAYVGGVEKALHAHRLGYWDFGLFTVVFSYDQDQRVKLYEATCDGINDHGSLRQRLVDVGIAGRWLRLNRSMLDFDINEHAY